MDGRIYYNSPVLVRLTSLLCIALLVVACDSRVETTQPPSLEAIFQLEHKIFIDNIGLNTRIGVEKALLLNVSGNHCELYGYTLTPKGYLVEEISPFQTELMPRTITLLQAALQLPSHYTHDEITLPTYFHTHTTFLKNWVVALQRNPSWKELSTSEPALRNFLQELLDQHPIYQSTLNPFLQAMGYQIKTVSVDPITHLPAKDLTLYASVLKPLGIPATRELPFPYPAMVTLEKTTVQPFSQQNATTVSKSFQDIYQLDFPVTLDDLQIETTFQQHKIILQGFPKERQYKLSGAIPLDNADQPIEELQPQFFPIFAQLLQVADQLAGDTTNEPLSFGLYMPNYGPILKKWALTLKQSKQWQIFKAEHAHKPAYAYQRAEYALIRRLMLEYAIFGYFDPLLTAIDHHIQTIHVEKVAYRSASDFDCYHTDLQPFGIEPKMRIPVPLMLYLYLKENSH